MYGSPYIRAAQQDEEDSVSMLPQDGATRPTRTHSQTAHLRNSSGDDMSTRTPSWLAEPQETVPYAPPRVSSPPLNLGFSALGGSEQSPYQEQVAWANSTHFRAAPVPAPQMVQTSYASTTGETRAPPRKYFRHPRRMLEPWMPGVWTRFPWWGFGALFLVLVLTGASAGVLLAARGTTMEDWRLGREDAQPYVYLSVFEMAMNLLILFALVDGAVIRFWRQLLQGTTLDAVHDTYESMFLWPAVKRVARLRFNLVAVGCILASVSFARGPLFHRALTIEETSRKNVQSVVDLQIAPGPVVDFFAGKEEDPLRQGDVTSEFADLVKNLGAGNPMAYEQPASCGYCTGSVTGYTFKATCESSVQSIDLNTKLRECKACETDDCKRDCESRKNTDLQAIFFSVGYEASDEHLVLTSTHKTTTSCSGDIHTQKCTLTPAKSEIPFVLSNGTIDRTFDDPTQEPSYTDADPADTAIMRTYWPLSLATLFPPTTINVSASADYTTLNSARCVPTQEETDTTDASPSPPQLSCSNATMPAAKRLPATDPSATYATTYTQNDSEDPLCGTAWKDPMPEMIRTMQNLAFRTTIAIAMAAAPATDAEAEATTTQRIPVPLTGTLTHPPPTYKTSTPLLALAITVSLASVAALIPLYYGFWELGRDVSLDPLEVARAFGAPIMEELDGNSSGAMVGLERGGMAVRYGVVERVGEGKKLRVEECGKVNVRGARRGEVLG